MVAPTASRSSVSTALTAARVPTGMKHGVGISPCAVLRTPDLARPRPHLPATNLPSFPFRQHGVAERSEPIAAFESDGVCVSPTGSHEGSEENQKAGALEVEVGHDHV